MAALQWLTRTGQFGGEKRDECILASDVLGLSMLVVEMNHHLQPGATPATVIGPFHIEGSPELDDGKNMADGQPGTPLYITGKVTDLVGQAVGGALLDVWQADGQGLCRGSAGPRCTASAREVYLAVGRNVLCADNRPARLHHSDGRSCRGADLADGHQPRTARRTSTSCWMRQATNRWSPTCSRRAQSTSAATSCSARSPS